MRLSMCYWENFTQIASQKKAPARGRPGLFKEGVPGLNRELIQVRSLSWQICDIRHQTVLRFVLFSSS